MKILLIEDELDLQHSILLFLHNEGFVIESAADFSEASDKISSYDYDCILIDITLPKGNGLDLVRQLKQYQSKAGIIIISAKNSLDDKIAGLEIGADDYLPKHFHLSELNARIKAVIRRKNFDGNLKIMANEITIHPESRAVSVNGEDITLTTKEYDLLLYLVSNKNRVLSKNAIAEHLIGDHADQNDNHDFIYTHLKNLRKKLTDKNCTDYIKTIYGIGYSFKIN